MNSNSALILLSEDSNPEYLYGDKKKSSFKTLFKYKFTCYFD